MSYAHVLILHTRTHAHTYIRTRPLCGTRHLLRMIIGRPLFSSAGDVHMNSQQQEMAVNIFLKTSKTNYTGADNNATKK